MFSLFPFACNEEGSQEELLISSAGTQNVQNKNVMPFTCVCVLDEWSAAHAMAVLCISSPNLNFCKKYIFPGTVPLREGTNFALSFGGGCIPNISYYPMTSSADFLALPISDCTLQICS